MNLVYVNGNRPITDSLKIAVKFKKEHRRVMQDIRELECSEEFRQHHFVLSSYVSEQNKDLPMYQVDFDGFMFVVMGYTGSTASKLKEDYINEFNNMRQQLTKPQHSLPQNYKEALIALVGQVERTEQLEAKIEADKPLMLFAESLQVSEDSILIGELAKLLKQNGIDIGQNRLFITLRKEGYLMSHGEQYNMPTQRSMDLKLMEIKTGSRNGSDGTIRITRTPKITGKGQIYFINKFKSKTQAS